MIECKIYYVNRLCLSVRSIAHNVCNLAMWRIKEADGKWISVEYKKLAKILCPEGFAEIRKQKSEALNKAIQKKIEIDKCPNCEGKFKQSRSGSSVVVCLNCKKKYKYKKSKK